MTSQAAQFVGTIPENYDRGLGPHIFFDYAADIARRAADLRPKTVLELAAGTGILTRKLRDAVEGDCDLIASDLNPPMLDVAKAKFAADEKISFEQIDATDIGFDDASFDLVACQFGIMFFPDKDRSYAEVSRVLKPGGIYLFNVWDSLDNNPFARITHEVLESFFSDDPPGFYQVPFGYNHAGTIEESVRGAGFDRVTIETVPITVKIPSAENFARGLVFGNPVHEEITSRGGNPEELFTAVTAAIEERLGAEMPLQALVITASKP